MMSTTDSRKKTTQLWRFAVIVALLSACGPDEAPEPTDDKSAASTGTRKPKRDAGKTEEEEEEEEEESADEDVPVDEDDESTEAPVGDAASPSPSKGDAGAVDASKPAADAGSTPPASSDKVLGIDFFQRIAGKWFGINSNTPIGFDFPMTAEFVPHGDGMLFGQFKLDNSNNVLWGFNIETYDGKDVLSYRNGGRLLGLVRDSRTKLVEYDAAKGYYRFCAVKEHGLPMPKGCDYIDARYTFTGSDRMLFEVFTRAGTAHVHWEATRMKTVTLPAPFPATTKSQGDGSAAWPDEAGI